MTLKGFFVIVSFIVCSCNQQHNKFNNLKVSEISLDSFKTIPTEINTFFCCYSENDIQFKKEEYLFTCNADSIAFISVNQKMIKLKLTSTTRLPGSFTDNNYSDIYSNGIYKVTVNAKYDESFAEDNWWNRGTITVENKNRGKVTKKFIGACGYKK